MPMKRPRKQKPEGPASNAAGKGDLVNALARLNECYQRAVRDEDNRTAFAVQREINRLLGLGAGETAGDPPPLGDAGPGAPGAAAPAPAPPAPEPTPEEPPADQRTIENQALADVVAAIEGHLEPLGLSSDVNDTDADLIRAAGAEIRRLRKAQKRRRGKKKMRKSGGKKH